METAAPINRALRAMRARLSWTMFLRHAARATLFFFGILVVLRAIVWWQGTSRPDPSSLPYMLTWPFLLGAMAGAIVTALRRPSLDATAAILDARGSTRDRLLSARAFSQEANPTELQRLAVGETAAWLAGTDLRPLAPVRCPSELLWLLAPLATLALLWWHESDRAARQDAAIAAAREQAAPTAQSLEVMAEQLEQRAKEQDDETLRRIAERLKQSAAQLRAEAEQAGDTQGKALRQIAELEQLVKELQQPARATPDELNALADALAQHEETKEAAEAVRENRLAEAAQALEKAAENPAAQRAEAALQQAIEHLARRNEQASKQIQQLQQQAEQGGERQQLLQQLAQMLKQMPQQPKEGEGREGDKQAGKQQQEGGKKMTDEDLKKLLSALQQLKDQQQQGGEEEGQGGEPGEESAEGKGPITMLSFQQSPEGDPSGEIGIPSGQPGSEKDAGTTKDPFATEPGEGGAAQRREQLKSQLAEGESLSVLVPSAPAGDAKSARRYKELTEAAATAAEDAVLQEEIPLGARFLIKRYFEAIRPKE